MATQQEIAKVLHLKTVMPDIVFTGKNKKIYDEFLETQKAETEEFEKTIKKVKQIRKPINQEIEAKNVEIDVASSEETEKILHDLQDSESEEQ